MSELSAERLDELERLAKKARAGIIALGNAHEDGGQDIIAGDLRDILALVAEVRRLRAEVIEIGAVNDDFTDRVVRAEAERDQLRARVAELERERADALHFERSFRAALERISHAVGMTGSPRLSDVPEAVERRLECLNVAGIADKARVEERAAVVAWLRERHRTLYKRQQAAHALAAEQSSHVVMDGGFDDRYAVLVTVGEDIERGEHVKAP